MPLFIKISSSILAVNWKSFKYLISIKINSSRVMVQDRLKTLLQGYSFPYSVGQNVIVTNMNLRTSKTLQ